MAFRKRRLVLREKLILAALAAALATGLVYLLRARAANIAAAELNSPNSTPIMLILLMSVCVSIWYSVYYFISRSPKRRS